MADDPWLEYIALVRTGERTQAVYAQRRRQAVSSAREELANKRAEIAQLRRRLEIVRGRLEDIESWGRNLATANRATIPLPAPGGAPLGENMTTAVEDCERELRSAEQLLERARVATRNVEIANRERLREARTAELQAQRADDRKRFLVAVGVAGAGFLTFALLGGWDILPILVALVLSWATLMSVTLWVQNEVPRAALEVACLWSDPYDPVDFIDEIPAPATTMLWIYALGAGIALSVLAWGLAGWGADGILYAAVAVLIGGIIGANHEFVSNAYEACQDLLTNTEAKGDRDD